MNNIHINQLQHPITITVDLPGSLSYTIRALIIAAMTHGDIIIRNPAKCDDSYTMVQILQTLGIAIEEGDTYFNVQGSIADIVDKEYVLDAHISGRTARTALALLCVIPGKKTLTCDEGFKNRPVKDLVDALRHMGAEITYGEREGYLPVKISSSGLKQNTVAVSGTMSSQYISALLMIGPVIGGIHIDVNGEQVSKPFIDMTIQAMELFGVPVSRTEYKTYTVSREMRYTNIHTYIVEADAIAASYFWALAALTKSAVTVIRLSSNSFQGDVQFADVLSQMGCVVEKNNSEKWIRVTGTDHLTGVTINMNHIPDTVPTLAVLAAFATGTTVMTGLSHLRIKESDRIAAPKKELVKMGVKITATDDSLAITGGNPQTAQIATYGDHRIAMAFAIAGTKIIDGIDIEDPAVVNKSFPNFWKTLSSCGITMSETSL